MTIISAFQYKNVNTAALLADCLVSSECEPSHNFRAPGTTRLELRRTETGLFLDALNQKLTIVNDSLAFALAGRVDIAMRFAEMLMSRFEQTEISTDELSDFLRVEWHDSLSSTERSFVALICAIANSDKPGFLGCNFEGFSNYGGFAGIWLAGSGSELFLDTLANVGESASDINSHIDAQLNSMCILGKLYHKDMVVHDTYRAGIGGAYDLAFISEDGRRIYRSPGTLVVLLYIDIRRIEGETFWSGLPSAFLQIDNIGNLKVIRELWLSGENGNPISKARCVGVLPLLDPWRTSAVDQYGEIIEEGDILNSAICGEFGSAKSQTLVLRFSDGETERTTVSVFLGQPIIVVKPEGKHVKVRLESQLREHILNAISVHVDKATGQFSAR